MKCSICKHGETELKKTTVVLERENTTVVIKDVPAEVCNNCGEEYVSSSTNNDLLKKADAAFQKGIDLELLRFAA